jgi:hypothetical protein
MLYDIVMVSLIVVGVAGSVWASYKINQAAKAGKIRYIGKVKIERPTRVDKP